MVELGVEAPLLRQECEVRAAARDDADVDAAGPVAAGRDEEAVLDQAEECQLERRARGVHLVDEQAAALRLADQATGPRILGRADGPEEGGFTLVRRKGGEVDGHEAREPAAAAGMDRLGSQLLPASRLTADEDGGVARLDRTQGGKHPRHGGAAAEQPLVALELSG